MSTNAKITAMPGILPAWSFADRLRKARHESLTSTQIYTRVSEQKKRASLHLLPVLDDQLPLAA